MITLISQRVIKTKHGKVDALEYPYQEYFDGYGMNLVPIPNNLKNLDFYFGLPVKRIILTGGGDVHPNLYGEKEGEGNYSEERDETEKKLLDFAAKNKIPVLGICRGMQFLNVYFRGKLIKVENISKEKHVDNDHKIRIVDERLRDLIGKKIEVNSYHGYGLGEKEFSTELKIFAESNQGIIEGFYHPSLPIVGMQWHPERKSPDEKSNDKLMKAFLNKELFWEK